MKWSVAATLFAAALSLAGCSQSDSVGCAKNEECPAAHVCQGTKCEKICEADTECPNGMYCNGTICVEGTRAAPEIATVSGNSAQSCTPAGGTSGACLGTGLVVQGENLGGSTFVLEAAEAGLSDVSLQTGARVEATLVDLIPTSAVEAGTYMLVATNSAGKDEATVTLLQGETGSQGPSGPSGPSGPAGAAGDGGTGSAGATRYLYRNTNTTNDSATLTTSAAGDRLVVEVKAHATKTVSQDINDTLLFALCSDVDGCNVALGLTGLVEAETGRTLQGLYASPSCRFGLTSDRHWTTSAHCYTTYAQVENSFVAENWKATQKITWSDWNSTSGVSGKSPTFGSGKVHPDNPQLSRYRPLGSGRSGLDGGAAGGDQSSYPESTILNFIDACFFAEAEPDTAAGPAFMADDNGFHLIAAGPEWTSPPSNWNASSRTCVLIIED